MTDAWLLGWRPLLQFIDSAFDDPARKNHSVLSNDTHRLSDFLLPSNGPGAANTL